jgi:hypothetical protein
VLRQGDLLPVRAPQDLFCFKFFFLNAKWYKEKEFFFTAVSDNPISSRKIKSVKFW